MGFWGSNDDRFQPSPPRPRILPYVAVAFISALLGGVLSLGLAPAVWGTLISRENLFTSDRGNASAPITISASSSLSTAVVDINKAVGPSVVGVANFQSQRGFLGGMTEEGSGSGFIIDANKGYIATNYHVIKGAEKVSVSLEDGRNLDATIVGRDSRTDLAVLQITDANERKNLTQAQLGDSSVLQVGEPVVAIGNPGGEAFARSVTNGVVSALNRFLEIEGEANFNLIQTNAAINPGNSGGPLVNYQGQVIGINSAKNVEEGYEGMGFAIPIGEALPILNQLIQKGYATHAALYVTIDYRYTPEYASQRGWPEGAYVSKVTEGGPADKAGLKAGDIITKINDVEISTSLELTRQLFKYSPGEEIKVTYFRNDQTAESKTSLAEMKSE